MEKRFSGGAGEMDSCKTLYIQVQNVNGEKNIKTAESLW